MIDKIVGAEWVQVYNYYFENICLSPVFFVIH